MRVSSIFAVLLGLGIALTHAQSLAEVPQPPILLDSSQPQCSDGIDNDGDGKVDFPTDGLPYTGTGDDGCWDPSDNEERAGLPPGTSLSTSGECASSTLSIAGNTYNNCDWPGDITIAAPNITITASVIRGSVRPNTTAIADTLVIRDSDFTGGPISNRAVTEPQRGQTLIQRVRGRRFPWMIYTESGTVTDSVFYELCAFGGTHIEDVLTDGSEALNLQRNWFSTDKYGPCGGGAVSGVVAMYAHETGGWSDVSNKVMIDNRLQMGYDQAYWHAYLGDWCGDSAGTSGMTFSGNVLVAGGGPNKPSLPSVTGWTKAATNVWANNKRGVAATTTRANGSDYAEPAACY